MTPGELPNVSAAVQEFAAIWAESASRALEQMHGAPFTAAPQSPASVASAPPQAAPGAEPVVEPAPQPAPPDEDVAVRFNVSGRLSGKQSFRFSRPDGVRLTQMLMSEPIDAAVPFTDGHVETLSELFRQFAGLAATACKPKYGGAVEFAIDSSEPVELTPAGSAVWEFSSAGVAPIRWTIVVDAALQTSLESAREAQATAAAAAANVKVGAPQAGSKSASAPTTASPSASAASASADPATAAGASNLDLLLDVVLAATLRFGQRDMVLREILELRPGAVVELNRRIQEPAELLVAGRVIARGEVVIVDGSYGLRITDITQPHQRLESVETGAPHA